ncbi:hypothetical protein AMS68_001325 [Peltaster fructicola]|uniref:ferric-chelate reductase (NADPH) n=1 Tax=Peltaster fructicola TaxID=286661 RepID=A0A6H0XMF6_9PEZI|nr:hypothetical protein AMS68_001325 [Peltaster fructicola]
MTFAMDFMLYTVLTSAITPTFAAQGQQQSETSITENQRVQRYMIWSWLAVVVVVLIFRWSRTIAREIRTIVNMGSENSNDGRQRYYSIPNSAWAFFKRHFILAPLFSKRHNREFKLSAAITVSTLPARLDVLFLLALVAANASYCAITINWQDKTTFYTDAVHRTGVVIATNICALFLLAGRNNPLIYFLGISFDTYNLIHRWLGRIVVLEAIAHVVFWIVGKYATMDSKTATTIIQNALASSPVIISGTAATAAFIVLLLHSPGAIRHAFYETFLHVHILVAAVATGALWVHIKGLATQTVLLVAILFWAVERLVRLALLVRRNIKGGLSKAEFEALPGEAVRVTLHIARPWTFRPGQHIYLYVPSLGLWTSHPFSIVWSEDQDGYNREKALPLTYTDPLARKQTTMSLIVRRRTGFTNSLYKKAAGSKFTTTALVEGPYGQQCFRSYGTVMLFAAGVGITHQVPHVRDLVASFANGTCATRKVVLVWVIQSPEHLEWIRPWMTQILQMEKRRDVLKILLFVTRPRSVKEIHSPSSSVQMFPGKPDVAALLQKEQDHQVGAMAVSMSVPSADGFLQTPKARPDQAFAISDFTSSSGLLAQYLVATKYAS